MAINPIPLENTVEYSGLWWLPDEPDHRVPGVLRYKPESGVTLELIGAFEDRVTTLGDAGVTYVHPGVKHFPVIHGVAEAQEISLIDCLPLSSTRRRGARVDSPAKQSIRATFAVIGAKISSADDTAFCAVDFSVEYLGQWLNRSQLQASFNLQNGLGRVAINPLDDQVVRVGALTFELCRRLILPDIKWKRGSIVGLIQESFSFRVTRDEPQSLNAALESLRFARDLVSLAMHRSVGVVWLRAETGKVNLGTSEVPRYLRSYAEVLYRPNAVGKPNEDESKFRHQFFDCNALPLETALTRWQEISAKHQAAINMIMGLRNRTSHYIENDLLIAVGAAEVFHRGDGSKEKPIPDQEFREMREAALKQIPKVHQPRFKSAIRNDPTLQDRLIALAKCLDAEVISSLMPSIKWWAKRTAKARNDLAHQGQTPDHSFEELSAIVKVTTTVVVFSLLDQLGLSRGEQRELILTHPQISEIARVSHEILRER